MLRSNLPSLCPLDRPNNAFYLTPLLKPSDSCWFSCVPIGKNKLSNAVASMCKSAGIEGYKTNHSLRATAATRLYSSSVDEQLVMERTGHRSTEEIRSYKRTSSEAISDILNNVAKKPCTDVSLTQAHPGRAIDTTAGPSFNNVRLSIPTQLQTSQTDHAGAFYFSSCSNISINYYSSK